MKSDEKFTEPFQIHPFLASLYQELLKHKNGLCNYSINLYKGTGIFASEKPVRNTIKRLVDLSTNMVYPMHGSCIDKSLFSKYIESVMKNDFAYSGHFIRGKIGINLLI